MNERLPKIYASVAFASTTVTDFAPRECGGMLHPSEDATWRRNVGDRGVLRTLRYRAGPQWLRLGIFTAGCHSDDGARGGDALARPAPPPERDGHRPVLGRRRRRPLRR